MRLATGGPSSDDRGTADLSDVRPGGGNRLIRVATAEQHGVHEQRMDLVQGNETRPPRRFRLLGTVARPHRVEVGKAEQLEHRQVGEWMASVRGGIDESDALPGVDRVARPQVAVQAGSRHAVVEVAGEQARAERVEDRAVLRAEQAGVPGPAHIGTHPRLGVELAPPFVVAQGQARGTDPAGLCLRPAGRADPECCGPRSMGPGQAPAELHGSLAGRRHSGEALLAQLVVVVTGDADDRHPVGLLQPLQAEDLPVDLTGEGMGKTLHEDVHVSMVAHRGRAWSRASTPTTGVHEIGSGVTRTGQVGRAEWQDNGSRRVTGGAAVTDVAAERLAGAETDDQLTAGHSPAHSEPAPVPARLPHRLPHGPTVLGLSGTGLTLALAMSWVALSPSLLPRSWWATAGSVGLSMTFGYLIGTLVQRLWIRLSRALRIVVTIDPAWGRRLRIVWFAALVAGTLVSWAANHRRQVALEQLVGVHAAPFLAELVGLLLGAAIFAFLVCTGLLVAALWRWTTRRLSRLLTDWVAPILATALIVGLAVAIGQGVVVRPLVESVYSSAAAANGLPWPNRSAPTEATRSGSPNSYEAWDALGAQGQAVVSDGPRAQLISQVTAKPAIDPIRVYAGLEAGRDMQATAQAVVRELDRTNAWDREYLLVATGVGSGWVDEWSVESVEYMTGGNCATASMQYSFLPSGAAFVLDRSSPTEAGKALWSAVKARWDQLPPSHRPKLLAGGESLGSYGGQAAFSSPQELLSQVSGAVWVGTPSFTPLWRQFTDSRREGSPQIAPVIDNGRQVRFITTPDELGHDFYGGTYEPWQYPRVVYLQHASDPVVWWSPSLIWHEPDWMREAVGRDVVDSVQWIPWVSFWQIAFDVPAAINAPSGHGHQYSAEVVPAWNAVLGYPVGSQQVLRIQNAIASHQKDR